MTIIALNGFFILLGVYIPELFRAIKHRKFLKSLKPGDFVSTSFGAYGEIVGIKGPIVILEFGHDKHCRMVVDKDVLMPRPIVKPKKAKKRKIIKQKPVKQNQSIKMEPQQPDQKQSLWNRFLIHCGLKRSQHLQGQQPLS